MTEAHHFGIVAGEASGDILGAGLIESLRQIWPAARFSGIGGPAMERLGCESLAPMERLAVMGLVEPLARLPELLRIKRRLERHFRATRPAAFIGIDAPDFNLRLAKNLHRRGIATAHYVSPSVWAWRKGRIHGIARSIDLMLTLFPFETAIYREHGIQVRCVGHPLADAIDPTDMGHPPPDMGHPPQSDAGHPLAAGMTVGSSARDTRTAWDTAWDTHPPAQSIRSDMGHPPAAAAKSTTMGHPPAGGSRTTMGHPSTAAEKSASKPDSRESARRQLGIGPGSRVIALLPGSRKGEITRMAPVFLAAAAAAEKEFPGLRFLLPCTGAENRALVENILKGGGFAGLDCQRLDDSRQAMAAADFVILASGTATLEAMLLRRPMAVCYKLAPLTHAIASRIVTVGHMAIPNLLAGERLVPEYVQDEVNPQNLLGEIRRFMENPAPDPALLRKFAEQHELLRKNASSAAAVAIREMLVSTQSSAD